MKYELEVTFNEWVGNIQEEFCAYVLGYSRYDGHDWCIALSEKFAEEEGIQDDFTEFLTRFYDTHGETICYIKSDKILRIKFDKNPKEHLPMIKRRIAKFEEAYKDCYEFAMKGVKILDAKFIEQTITEYFIELPNS